MDSIALLSSFAERIHRCGVKETSQMLSLFQEYLMQLLGAQSVIWMTAYRGNFGKNGWKTDLLDGWKPLELVYPHDYPAERIFTADQYLEVAAQYGLDPFTEEVISCAGKTRTHRYSAFDERKDWWIEKVRLDGQTGDRLIGAFSLDELSESYFLVDAPAEADLFEERHEAELLQALNAFPRMHYWLFLERGLVAPATRPLSPRQREILRCLIGPSTEKQISEQLALTENTVHGYVKNIYQIFGVSNRTDLLGLWFASI